MGIISIPIKEAYEDIKNNIIPGGCQTSVIIGNETKYNFELSGSHCGAGDVIEKFGIPSVIKPGEAKGVLVDSDGGSSQICSAYGIKIDGNSKLPRYLLMFYGYNPKLDGSQYSGLRNPVKGGGMISKAEWDKSRFDEGKFPGNEICEDANSGTGPDWQIDATKHPLKRYKIGGDLFVQMKSFKDHIDGGSRHYVEFRVSDKDIDS